MPGIAGFTRGSRLLDVLEVLVGGDLVALATTSSAVGARRLLGGGCGRLGGVSSGAGASASPRRAGGSSAASRSGSLTFSLLSAMSVSYFGLDQLHRLGLLRRVRVVRARRRP